MGIIGHFVLFLNWYQIGMHTQSAEPGCEILLKYIHPAMADLGILAGVLFAVSAYGFFTKKELGFPAVRDRDRAGFAWKLVHQCALYGRWPASNLLSPLLALSDYLLPVHDEVLAIYPGAVPCWLC